MSVGARTFLALTVLSVAAPLQAQSTPGTPGCGGDSRLLRTTLGATAGAIVGLVAVNIKYSDWSERNPSNLGMIRLNAGVVGAMLGASVGMFQHQNTCQPSGRTVPPRSRGLYAPITVEEIQRSAVTGTVYDVVFTLRRQWLNTRGVELSETPTVSGDPRSGVTVTPGNPTIVVYLDNAQFGDMTALRTIPIVGVTGVKYYDAAQATQRWGTGHNHGAIQVLTTTTGGP